MREREGGEGRLVCSLALASYCSTPKSGEFGAMLLGLLFWWFSSPFPLLGILLRLLELL